MRLLKSKPSRTPEIRLVWRNKIQKLDNFSGFCEHADLKLGSQCRFRVLLWRGLRPSQFTAIDKPGSFSCTGLKHVEGKSKNRTLQVLVGRKSLRQRIERTRLRIRPRRARVTAQTRLEQIIFDLYLQKLRRAPFQVYLRKSMYFSAPVPRSESKTQVLRNDER